MSAKAEIKIYNICGELVKNLYYGTAYQNEEVSVYWDGKNENGKKQITGIYFYQLKVNGKPYQIKKLVVIE